MVVIKFTNMGAQNEPDPTGETRCQANSFYGLADKLMAIESEKLTQEDYALEPIEDSSPLQLDAVATAQFV